MSVALGTGSRRRRLAARHDPARRLGRSGLLVAGSVGLANALNGIFHFVLARILEPGEYSLLASLLAVVLILGVPVLALQASVAREVAGRLREGRPDEAGLVLRETLHALVRPLAAALAVGACVGVPLALRLHVHRPAPAAAAAVVVVLSLALPVAWGVLQAEERFLALGAVQSLASALRLALGAWLGILTAGAGGAMAGIAIATAAALVCSLVPLAPLWRASRGLALRPRRLLTAYSGGAALTLSLFAALTNVDVLVSRLAFVPERAGHYAAASVGARTLLLVPIAVTTVLFPRVATLGDPRGERRHLLLGLGAVGAVCAAAAIPLFAIPRPLLELTFGGRYDDAAPWLGPLALAMGLYALANVYLYHFLSLGRTGCVRALVPLFAVQLAGFAAWHGSPRDLIAVQLACGAATLAACELFERRR